MKYLVNRTTKEHRIAGKDWQDTDTDYWRVVQADSEGWLPHTGNVCPLPEDSRCEVRCVGCNPTDIIPAGGWLWNIPMTGTYRITHYRPILEAEKVEDHLSAAEWNKRVRDSTDKLLAEAGYQPDCSIRHGLAMLRLEAEPVQEPEPQTIGDLIRRDHPYKDRKQAEKVQEPEPIPAPQYDPRSVSFNLLDRLKAAHAQAQTIPDLEAELRGVLAGMGYDLVKRSPFVNQCCGNPAQCWEPCGELGKSEDHVAVAEPEPAVETAQIKIDWPPCNPGCDEDFNGYRTKLCRCAPAKESVQKQTKPTEDMTDWRNWREGDVLTCVRPFTGYLSEGENYVVSEDVTGDYVGIILQGDPTTSSFRPDRFRFHSRPAKGEK